MLIALFNMMYNEGEEQSEFWGHREDYAWPQIILPDQKFSQQ